MLNLRGGSACSISFMKSDLLMLVISLRHSASLTFFVALEITQSLVDEVSLPLPEFAFVGVAELSAAFGLNLHGLGCSSTFSARLCHGGGACGPFLVDEGILLTGCRLNLSRIEWLFLSIRRPAYFRCDVDDALCRLSRELNCFAWKAAHVDYRMWPQPWVYARPWA